MLIYGISQVIATALLFVDESSNMEVRKWATRPVDYGLYVVLLTIMHRQVKQSAGDVTVRRMVQYGIYSSVILSVKYIGSWFYMEQTRVSLAAVGVACFYALWYFVIIGFVSLLWYGAMAVLQISREQDESTRQEAK